MPNYGVIDLGSNTIRLVIYEVRSNIGSLEAGKPFKSLLNDKVMAGLAAHIDEGVFTARGIKRAVDVLKGHAKRARYFGLRRLDVFATAVLRNCSNSAAAIAEIEEQTGMRITLLSAQEEAHLGFVGAMCDRSVQHGTLVDIGGGSTELTRIENGCDFDDTSLPQGSLSSYARFVSCIIPSPDEMYAIATAFRNELDPLAFSHPYSSDALYGIGGSVRAAAKMFAAIQGSDVRPKTMTLKHIREILELCARDRNRFAHTALKAAPERIHTLVPGCIIACTLLETLGARELHVCKYGIREGYLIERMLDLQPPDGSARRQIVFPPS